MFASLYGVISDHIVIFRLAAVILHRRISGHLLPNSHPVAFVFKKKYYVKLGPF